MRRLLALLVLAPTLALAQTGVSDDRVSLPEGPGSLEGVGENVQMSGNMGTMTWSHPIAVTPGFAGVTPALALAYDSGGGSGIAGIGWRLAGVPSIKRNSRRGLPRYGIDDDFVLDGAELVRIADDPPTYRARYEKGFERYVWLDAGDGSGGYWRVDHPDGRRAFFGADSDGTITPNARATDPERGGTYEYHLVEMLDVYDHAMRLDWAKHGNHPLLQRVGYVYPDGPEPTYAVTLRYEDRRDETGGADLSSALGGFDLRLQRRLAEISVFARDQRIRRYRLHYEPYADAGGFTRLVRLETYGQRDTLYPIAFDFTYSRALGGLCGGGVCPGPFMVDMGSIGVGLESGRVNLIDINGDGLPDVLISPADERHVFVMNVPDAEGGSAFGPRVTSAYGDDNWRLDSGYTQLLDANGDGFSDLINSRSGRVLFNEGGGDWARDGDLGDTAALPDFDLDFEVGETELGRIRFLDYDHDKRIDVLRSIRASTDVYRNLGGGGFARDDAAQPLGAGIEEDRLEFADMNGDGLLDPVKLVPGAVEYRLNLGYGRWSGWIRLADAPLDEAQVPFSTLDDLNGDGLADLVTVSGTTVSVSLNRNGASFFETQVFESADVEGVIPERGDGVSVLFADMNANGSTDIVWVDRQGKVDYLELFPVRPNLLSRIENGIGMVMDVSYGTSAQHLARALAAGQPWLYALPHPMIVVDRVVTWDRLSLVHQVDEYAFRDGFYDGIEKQFRGYAGVTSYMRVGDDGTHEPGTRVQVFDVGADDPYRHGLTLETRTTSDGRPLSIERAAHEDCPLADVPPPERLDLPVRFVCPVATETVIQEGADRAAWRTLRTRSVYDGYGNVVRSEQHGVTAVGDGACAPCDRDPSVFGEPCGGECLGDELFTETDFIAPGEATSGRWILHAPWRQRAFGRDGGEVKETLTYYDGPDFVGLPAGRLDQGKTTRVTQKIAHDDGAVIEATRSAFDTHGNVIDMLDPLGAPDGTTHRRQYAYDTEGLRVLRTDLLLEDPDDAPYRMRRETRFERLFDKVSEATGWMRVVGDEVLSPRRSSLFSHDEFGRIVGLVKPGGDTPQNPTQVFAYELASPVSRVITRQRTRVGGQLDLEAIRCLDGRGREVQTRTRIAADRYRVTGFKRYNPRSAPVEVFQPYQSDSGECDTAPPAGVLSRRYRYDSAHRPLGIIEPDEAIYGTATESRLEYGPLWTATYDGEDTDPASDYFDTPTVQYTDGLDRPVRIERPLLIGEAPPTYTLRYDSLGRLRGFVDPAGHEQVQRYDLLDRLISIDGPNSGRTEMAYDAAGNVIEERDARGFVTRKAFDGVNRPVARWEADDEAGTRTAWTYDVAPADCPPDRCTLPEGKPSRVAYPGLDGEPGVDHMGYDIRGRPIWQRRRIDGFDYAATMAYDNADREVSTVYPDGTEIERRYDGGSRLVSIPGIIDTIEYDARNLRARMANADGTVDTWTHDDRMRQTSARVEGTAGVLQGFEYGRDRVDNLETVTDVGLDDGGPRGDTVYHSDAWYRLTRAEVDGVGGRPETLDYVFDDIDNLLSRTSSLGDDNLLPQGMFGYGEGGAGPNAITSAGALSMAYDDAGYAIERDGRAMDWDHLGRLVRVGDAARFAYGSGPDRVLKDEGGSRTHSPMAGFDVRDGISALYVRIGKTRVARIERDALAPALLGDANGNGMVDAGDAVLAEGEAAGAALWSSARRLLLETGDETVWLHHDHLGSITLATADGEARGRRGFYPGGAARGSATGYVDDYGFTGQEHDRSTGLIHFQWRYLDPAVGRWVSVDPLFRGAGPKLIGKLGQSTTAYAYVANRWGDAVDPTGLCDECDPSLSAGERAAQLHSFLDPQAQRRRTTAVTEAVSPDGATVRIVTASGDRRLGKRVRDHLLSGEVEGTGRGHAEVTGVNAAADPKLRRTGSGTVGDGRGTLKATGTAASRPICAGCQATIGAQDVQPLSELKAPSKSRAPAKGGVKRKGREG